jgi:sugar fermentation stimulation protein A
VADKGIYIAVFYLSRPLHIQIGRLGRASFKPGFYFYVGSAQRNLSSRLARHARRRKPLRWQVDYLSCRATMIGAMIVPGPRRRECELAQELSSRFELAVPRFGVSDCRCPGHLFYSPGIP